MAGKDQFTAQQFIDAIKGTGGVISLIAKKVGCDWHTAKKYIDERATVKQAYDDEVESILDLGEAKLYDAVKSGEFQAIKYLLSTKGKRRGYVERIEQTGKDGGPVETKGTLTLSDWRKLADERLNQAQERMSD